MVESFNYSKGIVGTYTGIPFYMNKQTINDGDTLIFSPVMNSQLAEDIVDLDFLSQIASLLSNMYPKCRVIVSPVEFNIKVIKNG